MSDTTTTPATYAPPTRLFELAAVLAGTVVGVLVLGLRSRGEERAANALMAVSLIGGGTWAAIRIGTSPASAPIRIF
jgi:hypothetical protein